MDKQLELQLVNKYPKILRDYGGDKMNTCMAWGMECGDGWYDLLDKCMQKLQYFCDLCAKEDKEVQVIANQIKEKFGTLRFYFSVIGATEVECSIVDDIINEAEAASSRTCEVSGKMGSVCQRGGWYRTLCYEEARKSNYKACDQATEEYWKEKDEGKWKEE